MFKESFRAFEVGVRRSVVGGGETVRKRHVRVLKECRQRSVDCIVVRFFLASRPPIE